MGRTDPDRKNPENCTEFVIVQLPPEDVGRIIGKQGAQVRALREQTGCEINVFTKLRSFPIAKLKGTAETVALARTLIAEICGGDGFTFLRGVHESTMQYFAENDWLTQQETAANVKTELKGRSLKITSLSGDTNVAQKFKLLLEERIKTWLEELVVQSLSCHRGSIRLIKEDKTLNKLKDNSNLRLDIIKEEDGQVQVQLKGTRMIIDEARQIIENISENVVKHWEDCFEVAPYLFIDCAQKKLSDFEADLKEGIADKFEVKVQFTPSNHKIILRGLEKNVLEAKDELEQLLFYYFPKCCASLCIPLPALPVICGPNNEYITQLSHIPDIIVSFDENSKRIWICGKPAFRDNAYKQFTAALAKWRARNSQHTLPSVPNGTASEKHQVSVSERTHTQKPDNAKHFHKVAPRPTSNSSDPPTTSLWINGEHSTMQKYKMGNNKTFRRNGKDNNSTTLGTSTEHRASEHQQRRPGRTQSHWRQKELDINRH